MKLSKELPLSLIKVGLVSEDKEEAFEEVLQLFVNAGLIKDRDTALRAILEREEMMTTGISRGLGIPHGKVTEISERMMAIGVSKDGIEYDSMDGEPVHVMIMVFSEVGNPGPHIEALAEISRLFSIPGFVDRMCSASTPEEVLEIITEEE